MLWLKWGQRLNKSLSKADLRKPTRKLFSALGKRTKSPRSKTRKRWIKSRVNFSTPSGALQEENNFFYTTMAQKQTIALLFLHHHEALTVSSYVLDFGKLTSFDFSWMFTFSISRMGDGTFSAVPKLFAQLYTIHSMEENNSIPIVYALLPNKRADTYIRMFTIVIKAIDEYRPEIFISDYESGVIAALPVAMSNTKHFGCYFHFRSALLKNIHAKELKNSLGDPELAKQMRKVAALAFLPSQEQVLRGWHHVNTTSSDKIRPFLEYFEDQWIGKLRAHGRFPKVQFMMWNFTFQVAEGIPITTNSLEGWHLKLSHLLEKGPRSLSNLLTALILDQASNDDHIDKRTTGIDDRKKPKVKATFTERIESIVASFDPSKPIDEYLTAVSTLMLNNK